MADPIPCAAGCKRVVFDEKAALASGWQSLPISSRWRCPACTRELTAASKPHPQPVAALAAGE